MILVCSSANISSILKLFCHLAAHKPCDVCRFSVKSSPAECDCQLGLFSWHTAISVYEHRLQSRCFVSNVFFQKDKAPRRWLSFSIRPLFWTPSFETLKVFWVFYLNANQRMNLSLAPKYRYLLTSVTHIAASASLCYSPLMSIKYDLNSWMKQISLHCTSGSGKSDQVGVCTAVVQQFRFLYSSCLWSQHLCCPLNILLLQNPPVLPLFLLLPRCRSVSIL